jgi:hypothetical protein
VAGSAVSPLSAAHGALSVPDAPAPLAEPVLGRPTPEPMTTRRNTAAVTLARGKGKGRRQADELPETGLGTIRNPRVPGRGGFAGLGTRSGTVHLPVELAKRLGVYCAQHDRSKSDVIAAALASFLDT